MALFDPQRTRHQILNGARHQHLARAGDRRHARANVNGNAADIIADHFALARYAARTVESSKNAVERDSTAWALNLSLAPLQVHRPSPRRL
jgi:hypothetical protein